MEFKFANLEQLSHKQLGRLCERSHLEKLGLMPTLLEKQDHQQRSELLEVPVQIMQSCLLFPATEL
jgi:hypothetical protein